LLSFVLQRGKSACCQKKLSWQYPLVEFLSGALFVFVGWKTGLVNYFANLALLGHSNVSTDSAAQINWASAGAWEPYLYGLTLVFFLFICSALLVLIFTDLKYLLLPNSVVITAIIASLLYLLSTNAIRFFVFYQCLATDNNFVGKYLLHNTDFFWRQVWLQGQDFVFTLEGSLIVALVFLVLILVTKGRGMGGGDLKMAILIGLVCGWPNMLVALFLGFTLGCLVSLVLMALRILKFGDRIPLGPFLAMGTFVTMFYGEQILDFYYRIFIH